MRVGTCTFRMPNFWSKLHRTPGTRVSRGAVRFVLYGPTGRAPQSPYCSGAVSVPAATEAAVSTSRRMMFEIVLDSACGDLGCFQ